MIVVAGAVAITRGGRDVVTYVRQTVEELKALVEGWRDLERTLFVELTAGSVDVREIGDEQLERLAEDST